MPTIAMSGKTIPGLKCPPGQSEITYWDDGLPGFGLRCFANGKRSWLCQYRTREGVTRRQSLGSPDVVRYAKAREEAEKRYLAPAKTGGDAVGEAKQAKVERRNAITVGELVERYLVHQKTRLRLRSYEELRRHLAAPKEGSTPKPRHGRALDIAPLRKRPAAGIKQRDIVELLQGIAELAPTQANRVRASLSAMYSWGMRAGLVAANPVVATFVPTEEKPRERVLSDDELALIWRCTSGAADHDRIVRLLMLTGARRAEIAGICWPELEIADEITSWTLPSERSKNKLPHMLVLPLLAVDQLPGRQDGREMLFGEGQGPFSGWSRCKTRLDARIAKANGGKALKPWTLHDLRRTFVTRLNDLGVEPHVIEACVNHVGGIARAGIAGVYNRSAYAVQKAAALALWCDHIARLTGEKHREGATALEMRRAG